MKNNIRKSPGESGTGEYYHIEIRPKEQFATFLTQDVGKKGGLMRVAGKRPSGAWQTAGWLVEKDLAHVSPNGRLIIDTPKARTLLKHITQPIVHKKGDIFTSTPRTSARERKQWPAM